MDKTLEDRMSDFLNEFEELKISQTKSKMFDEELNLKERELREKEMEMRKKEMLLRERELLLREKRIEEEEKYFLNHPNSN